METIIAPEVNHAAELKALTLKLTAIDKNLQILGRDQEIKKIIEMIKIRKGWTTPAEFAFANSIANVVAEQIRTMQNLLQGFSKGADLVREG
jgi:hypothetical protein